MHVTTYTITNVRRYVRIQMNACTTVVFIHICPDVSFYAREERKCDTKQNAYLSPIMWVAFFFIFMHACLGACSLM